jgi:hypothetical protein
VQSYYHLIRVAVESLRGKLARLAADFHAVGGKDE